MKKIGMFFIVVACLFGIFGCGSTNNKIDMQKESLYSESYISEDFQNISVLTKELSGGEQADNENIIINYPYLESVDNVNVDRINNQIIQFLESENLVQDREGVYEVDITYEVTYQEAKIISILFSGYISDGGSYVDYDKALTFDLQSGELLTLSDFYTLEELKGALNSAMVEGKIGIINVPFGEQEAEVLNNEFLPLFETEEYMKKAERFYLTEDGVYFIIDEAYSIRQNIYVEYVVDKEADTYPEEFILGQNLNNAITELALMYDEFDVTKTKEDIYPVSFIAHYCQNSRQSFDYLEQVREEKDGILSEEEVRYIQYSLTGEEVDFQNYIPEEGIDTYQTASGFSYGKILSYEAEEIQEEVHLVAEFKRETDGSKITSLYELDVVLVKNPQSCFDGYSIKSLSAQDITPVIHGDNQEHTFCGFDLEVEENGVFTFENHGGDDDVQYGRYIEIDLSTNGELADFVRENAGAEFEVTYFLGDSMTQPVYQVVPVCIKLYEE